MYVLLVSVYLWSVFVYTFHSGRDRCFEMKISNEILVVVFFSSCVCFVVVVAVAHYCYSGRAIDGELLYIERYYLHCMNCLAM